MPTLDNLFAGHLDNLSRALNRTTQRHGLLINNLANVNTPGYRRRDVDFAITLAQEEGRSTRQGEERVTGGVRIDGNGVDLEQEVTALAETEIRYQMLTEMTNRYFSGLKNVIREGR